MKKHNIATLIPLMVAFLFTMVSLPVQGVPPPVSSSPGFIDGGIFILLIGAALYGYYKLKEEEEKSLN